MTVLQAASDDTEGLVAIDALGTAGVYRTRNREVITDTAGVPVAALSLVPPLYVARTIGAQRKVRPLPIAQRGAALHKTAEIFTNSLTAGLDFDHYIQLASRVSGLPIGATRAGGQPRARWSTWRLGSGNRGPGPGRRSVTTPATEPLTPCRHPLGRQRGGATSIVLALQMRG